jgi:hypothetical protein
VAPLQGKENKLSLPWLCEECGSQFYAPYDQYGKSIECSYCHQVTKIVKHSNRQPESTGNRPEGQPAAATAHKTGRSKILSGLGSALLVLVLILVRQGCREADRRASEEKAESLRLIAETSAKIQANLSEKERAAGAEAERLRKEVADLQGIQQAQQSARRAAREQAEAKRRYASSKDASDKQLTNLLEGRGARLWSITDKPLDYFDKAFMILGFESVDRFYNDSTEAGLYHMSLTAVDHKGNRTKNIRFEKKVSAGSKIPGTFHSLKVGDKFVATGTCSWNSLRPSEHYFNIYYIWVRDADGAWQEVW